MELEKAVRNEVYLDSSEITEIVCEAMFFLYGQKSLPDSEELVEHLYDISGISTPTCNDIISQLQHKSFITVSEGHVSFATNGLWFLETCFMHGENIDSMELAESLLTNYKFFEVRP